MKKWTQLEFDFFSETHAEILKDFQGNKNGTDNERCLYYQYEYLINNNSEAWASLWILFQELCLKAVKKELKKKQLHFTEDKVLEKAQDACFDKLKIYKRAQKQGTFRFYKNFITAAYYGALHALYSSVYNKDINDAMNFLINEDLGDLFGTSFESTDVKQ